MGYKVKVPAESESGSLTAGSSTVFSEITGYHSNHVKNTEIFGVVVIPVALFQHELKV